ncbi:MAG: GAF domain-containing protein [Magnetococcales bacterium]|nr:GAF domain-containing protein [Magnetococcales bacterium]
MLIESDAIELGTAVPELEIIPPPPRLFMGIRLVALLELLLLLGIAGAIDFAMLEGRRFEGWNPNPLWLAVVLITVQYGTWEGLIAALAATAYLRLGNFPEPRFGQDLFDHLFDLMRLPLLWFTGAVLFGELRVRQIRERDTLRRYLIESRLREEEITKAYVRMHRAKDRLETQVAGQTSTVVSYFKAAQTMEWQDPASVMINSAELVRVILGADSFSLFTLEENHLEVLFREGWPQPDAFAQRLDANTPLFRAVIGNQHFLAIAQAADRPILGSDGVLAGPLINRENGNIVGMLKIERMEFVELNISSLEHFKALCEWIGASYDKATQFSRARSESVINFEHQLYSKSFLFRQVQLLTNLARRQKFDLCMIVIQVDSVTGMNLEEMRRIPLVLGTEIGKIMRKTDMVFDYERSGHEFALLLPATPADHLAIVERKVHAALQEQVQPQLPQVRFILTSQILHSQEAAK